MGDMSPAGSVVYTCPGCGQDAELPVVGLPIAQVAGGIVFDIGRNALPKKIMCRKCRRTFEKAEKEKE